MIINLISLFVLGLVFLVIFKKLRKNGLLRLVKGSLQLGILILFVAGFFKLFFTLPPNTYIKIIFFITYLWFTVGINVNFMVPLINLIDTKIEKKF